MRSILLSTLIVVGVLLAGRNALAVRIWQTPTVSNVMSMVLPPAGLKLGDCSRSWTTSTVYASGDIVAHQGQVLACVVGGTSSNGGELLLPNELYLGYRQEATGVTWTRSYPTPRRGLRIFTGSNVAMSDGVATSAVLKTASSSVIHWSGSTVYQGPLWLRSSLYTNVSSLRIMEY